MHHTEEMTTEQTVAETPEFEELSNETLNRAPGGGLIVLLCVFGLERS